MGRVVWSRISKISRSSGLPISVLHTDVIPSPSSAHFPSLSPKLLSLMTRYWSPARECFHLPTIRNQLQWLALILWAPHSHQETSCQTSLTVIIHHPECASLVHLLLHFEWTHSIYCSSTDFTSLYRALESNWLHFPFWLQNTEEEDGNYGRDFFISYFSKVVYLVFAFQLLR